MKDGDALVEALGRALKRVPGAEDPRWDALAAGDLAPDDVDALLRGAPDEHEGAGRSRAGSLARERGGADREGAGRSAAAP